MKIDWNPIKANANLSEHGVSFGTLADSVSILVGGLKAGTFERDGHRYDVTVKMTGLHHTRAATPGLSERGTQRLSLAGHAQPRGACERLSAGR